MFQFRLPYIRGNFWCDPPQAFYLRPNFLNPRESPGPEVDTPKISGTTKALICPRYRVHGRKVNVIFFTKSFTFCSQIINQYTLHVLHKYAKCINQVEKGIITTNKYCNLLPVKHGVWKPNQCIWNNHLINIAIVCWIPL